MNLTEAVELVNQMLEQHRVEVGSRPEIRPVLWKGIGMTLEEAKLVIQGFEDAKVQYQKAMNNAQTGGEITTVAAGGAGLAAMATGVALMLFRQFKFEVQQHLTCLRRILQMAFCSQAIFSAYY